MSTRSGTDPAGAPGARLLLGAPLAAAMAVAVADESRRIQRRHGVTPTLGVVLVGRRAESALYVRRLLAACRGAGAAGQLVELPGGASTARIVAAIGALNGDSRVHGVLVGMPLPRRAGLRQVNEAIDPGKDVDGCHPYNAGLLAQGLGAFAPATAEAAVEVLLGHDCALEGRRAVVIGRSAVVGRPAALLLLRHGCTVTICHSRTRDLAAAVREADIVIAAAGQPGLVSGGMLKPGAIVVDVGINILPDGRVVGDVDFASAQAVAAAIAPVPGGVGPLTNAVLLRHLVAAARLQLASHG